MIDSLYVTRENRLKGIATNLIGAVLQSAQKENTNKYVLESYVLSYNTQALHFYQTQGFGIAEKLNNVISIGGVEVAFLNMKKYPQTVEDWARDEDSSQFREEN